ncbi:MAG TPA: macro domain-containing protein, partial [Blastocatellia bacterium]|nr:macro domain-containing protein [Blastocatellia bacterium]
MLASWRLIRGFETVYMEQEPLDVNELQPKESYGEVRMKVELRKGDITNQPDIDAIVNAANTELWLGSGVAGAIRSRGGPEIEREAVAQGPISLGEAVRTTAGNLPNQFVIHAAAMGYREEDQAVPKRAGSASSETIIRNATANSISIADQSGCESIAFPALATGVGGFPLDECARVMIRAAQDYADNHPTSKIKRVIFV